MSEESPTPSHSAASTLEIVVYLSIVLLGALMGLEDVLDKPHEIGLVWSTTLGLTLAHLFAFRISMVYEEGFGLRAEWTVIAMMFGGAAALAFVATVPYFVTIGSWDPAYVTAGILMGVLSVSSYLAARSRFESTTSRIAYTCIAALIAICLAAAKAWLSH